LLAAVPLDEREREEVRNLRRKNTTLPQRAIEKGLQLEQAPLGPAQQVQS